MKLGKYILGALLALLMASPVVAADYDNVDPSGQTVTFWYQHSGDREAGLQEIIDKFNAENEHGITVVGEYQGGYSDIFQKMLALLGTNDVPNIVVAYQNQAATYQVVDGLIDMTPLVDSDVWGLSDADKADFFEGFYNSDIFPTFNNQRLGIAPNRSMEMLYVNLGWLEELRSTGHVSFEGAPQTPEQFREAACAASNQPFTGATALGNPYGYELSVDASRFASWVFGFGGNVFDTDANQYTLNSEEAVAAMGYLQDLFADGCAVFVSEPYGDQTNFGAGRTLFTVSSSSGLPFYEQAVEAGADVDWTVSAMPYVGDEPTMNVYGASVSMPAGHSPEADVASWLFLKYYTGTEAQAAWASASQYFPVRHSVADGLGDLFAELPSYQAAFDLLEYGIAEPNVPGYDFVRDLINIAMSDIMDGYDVQDTLDALNEEANDILAEQIADL